MATHRPSLAKGRILINEELCKGCELCISVCPYHLIHVAESYNTRGYKPAVLLDPEGVCTGCTLCAIICPDAVITVFRLARRSKKPLESQKTPTQRTLAA